jgi:predicted Zn-dependent peptidase
MIRFEKTCLPNGLKILVHEDRSTPLAAINILYDAGSKDEDPQLTGLAHLFEHLMFSGSVNIPVYDTPVQFAGGENNAFTNNDITNFYLTLPADNIETGFWLESDRMLGLDFSQKNLNIQKNVVIEEFKQRYLNQPYGDVMMRLRPLAYKVHPYRWSTIGMDISHIEKAELDNIKNFFYTHYAPNNAILSVTGNIKPDTVFRLAEKWFGPIEQRDIAQRMLTAEPAQDKERNLTVSKDVPANALYKAWHVGARTSDDFYALDLLTDILSGGESGRLNTVLVREKKLFSEINAYLSGEIDPGLLILHGKLMPGINFIQAEKAVIEILSDMKNNLVQSDEMDKVKNKFEASWLLSNTQILNKALNLAFYELIGKTDELNNEVDNYRNVTREMVLESSRKYLTRTNCSTIYYKSAKCR